MSSGCEVQFKGLLSKLNAVIRDKWPDALVDGAEPYTWARENLPDLMKRHDALEKEANERWLNGRELEFKSISMEWGRVTLEVMKSYSAHVRHREAA